MSPENEKYLFDNFKFFKSQNSTSSMRYGFNCGDGWFDLIKNLCEKLEELNLGEDFEVVQVKEKFGGLRFYVQGIDVWKSKQAYSLIENAEKASFNTCEKCSSKGKLVVINGWMKTLCESCSAKDTK